jgi:hypothetical protein
MIRRWLLVGDLRFIIMAQTVHASCERFRGDDMIIARVALNQLSVINVRFVFKNDLPVLLMGLKNPF